MFNFCICRYIFAGATPVMMMAFSEDPKSGYMPHLQIYKENEKEISKWFKVISTQINVLDKTVYSNRWRKWLSDEKWCFKNLIPQFVLKPRLVAENSGARKLTRKPIYRPRLVFNEKTTYKCWILKNFYMG